MTITVKTGTHQSDLGWANVISEYCIDMGISLSVQMGQLQNTLRFEGSEDSLKELLDHLNEVKERLTNKH